MAGGGARNRPARARAALVLAGVLAGGGVVGSAPAVADQQEDGAGTWVSEKMRSMTLEQKIGQMFVAEVWGKSADDAHPKNKETYGVATPAEVIQRYQVGGAIYFNNASTDNVDTPQQLARFSNGLQRAALGTETGIPLTVSIDQEGGRVTRIADEATEYPSAMAIGAGRDSDNARTAAAINAQELHAMGINQNFAPDADVNSNPLNPVIGSRSFSSDPALAGKMVAAQVDGYQNSGPAAETVSAAAKHFPGHGDAAADSHEELPTIERTEQEWRQIDLPPFKAAIDAGVDSIMTAHIAVPSLDPSGDPATLSKPILTGILREELGYQGLIVTDSLQMGALRGMYPDAEIPVRAIEAGADVMLMPPDLGLAIDSVRKAVQDGRLTEQRIDASVQRILELKHDRGIVDQPLVDAEGVPGKVGTDEHRAQIQQVTDRATTVLRNDAGLLPIKGDPGKVLVTGWNRPDFPGYPAAPVGALAEEIESDAAGVTALPTGGSPDAATIDKAARTAGESDLVIVLTNGLRGSQEQRDLVNALHASGTPVIAVAVQEPYDAGYVQQVPTQVATYDWRAVSMVTLAKVLLGEQAPQGKLPVDVPAGGDPNTTLYPFGHGLSW